MKDHGSLDSRRIELLLTGECVVYSKVRVEGMCVCVCRGGLCTAEFVEGRFD